MAAGLSLLAALLGSLAYATLLAVDCEASALAMNLFACDAPRLLSPLPSSLPLSVCVIVLGHLLALVLALFSLASLVHALTSRRRKRVVHSPAIPARKKRSAPARLTASGRQTSGVASNQAASPAPAANAAPAPAPAKRRLSAYPPIVDEAGLLRFVAAEEDNARQRARQAAEATGGSPYPLAYGFHAMGCSPTPACSAQPHAFGTNACPLLL